MLEHMAPETVPMDEIWMETIQACRVAAGAVAYEYGRRFSQSTFSYLDALAIMTATTFNVVHDNMWRYENTVSMRKYVRDIVKEHFDAVFIAGLGSEEKDDAREFMLAFTHGTDHQRAAGTVKRMFAIMDECGGEKNHFLGACAVIACGSVDGKTASCFHARYGSGINGGLTAINNLI